MPALFVRTFRLFSLDCSAALVHFSWSVFLALPLLDDSGRFLSLVYLLRYVRGTL